MNWQKAMQVKKARKVVIDRFLGQPPQRFQQAPEVTVAVVDDMFDSTHEAFAGIVKQLPPLAVVRHAPRNSNHGTLCAGLIAGAEDEESGFLGGVARPDSGIDTHLLLAPYNDGLDVNKDTALLEALRKGGASIISCSFGWGINAMKPNQAVLFDKQFRTMLEVGTLAVVAAGNEGVELDVKNSAFAQHTILVGATVLPGDDEEQMRTYTQRYNAMVSTRGNLEFKSLKSNFGAGITVCAPGSDGHWGSPVSTIRKLPSDAKSKRYGDHDSTSAACPMVAGVLALMRAVNPALSAARLKTILCLTADKIDPNCPGDGEWKTAERVLTQGQLGVLDNSLRNADYSKWYGFGRVNALAAVNQAILG